MKKINAFYLISFLAFSIMGCQNDNVSSLSSDNSNTTFIENFNTIDIELEETYTLSYLLKSNSDLIVDVMDSSIASLSSNVLVGKRIGQTSLTLTKEGKTQFVNINVHEKQSLSSTFSFDVQRLANKNIVAFGDSVTANATINGANTYYNNFANKYRMNAKKNYAIGGTTAMYMYEGSNIYKEYANNDIAIDGVRVVKKAYDNGELDDVDYAFIAYGHNDQYFQSPIENDNDKNYDINSFTSCHSFKGSYRYMINTLKKANPNVRIILLNCTYSEYDKSNPSRYGKTYSYVDYRNAINDIALEYSLTHIDPWEYLEMYYDNLDNKYYYKDSVHLTEKGHIILTEYIISTKEND